MKRTITLGVSLLAALSLAAVAATGAWASGSVLELKNGPTPVAEGATVYAAVALPLSSCLEYSKGTLTANDKPTDKAAFASPAFTECEPGVLSGNVTAVKVTSRGIASFKTTLVFSLASCLYRFKKFSMSFPIPGFLSGGGDATGTRAKGSAMSCEKTETVAFTADLTTEVFGEPPSAELH
jgi:hypothetical protein